MPEVNTEYGVVTIDIKNKYNFTNLNEFDVIYDIVKNGNIVYTERAAIPHTESGQTGKVWLTVRKANINKAIKKGDELLINIHVVHRNEQLFAPAGHEVAMAQFTLAERAPLAALKSKGNPLAATSSLHETIIGNEKVQLTFDAETAQLTALAFGGKNIIADGQGFIYDNHRWIENDRQGYDYYGPDAGKPQAQTANVLAIYFDLTDDIQLEGKKLVDDIEACGHLKSGFVGTPYLLHALTKIGREDVAYKLLLKEDFPSWLFPVTKGATTMWERWDGAKKDGTFATPEMNSFNHYAYGSIGDWLYREAVGIKEAAPGYKRIAIKPHTGGKFENMEASTITPYGKVAAAWKAKENVLKELAVEIPFNTTAEIYVPAAKAEAVKCDDATLKADGVVDGYVKFSVGSGKYLFTVE